MSSPDPKGKGKAPAVAMDERTPLLSSSSSTENETEASFSTGDSHQFRNNRTRKFLYIALFLVIISFLGILCILVLAASSYAAPASHRSTEDILRNGVVLKGPTNVEFGNVTQDGITIQLEGLVGINADWLLALDENRGGLFSGLRRSFGRWVIGTVKSVTVTSSAVGVYIPFSRRLHRIPTDPLLTLNLPEINIPLTTRPPDDDSWLTPISLPLQVKVEQSDDVLLEFLQNVWEMNRVLVTVKADEVRVCGGESSGGWRSWFNTRKTNVEKIVKYELPPLVPGGPSDDPIGDLITLESYSLHPIPPSTLGISAEAAIVNPLPKSIKGGLSNPIQFTISLLSAESDNKEGSSEETPTSAPVAQVVTSPIKLTHPNISLSLNGRILPLQSSSIPLLSLFLSNYLSGRPSPILISTYPSPPSSPFPFNISIPTHFPAPEIPPKVIKHVTIKNMKLRPEGEQLLASGIIIAEIELPQGMEELVVDVKKLLPDVLVSDGQFNTSHEGDLDVDSDEEFRMDVAIREDEPAFPAPPLPNPLPPGAFARIRPGNWLNATTGVAIVPPNRVAGLEEPKNMTIVTAVIKDVPLEILPGRSSLFSAFVEKVLFKGFAVAAVDGDAAVKAKIEGLVLNNGADEGLMELRGLPVSGSFRIARGDVLKVL
ncbi:hypothetical protein FRC03_005225 [Tulasnella sp. 419]|nr:hypothetical protein FRC03_005225 [Tulasnella sp. 419]